MRTLLAAIAFAVAGITTTEAANIGAMTGYAAKLDADSSALVYYTAAPDGFHVVVTTQQGLTDQGGRAVRDGVGGGAVGICLNTAPRGRCAGADRALQRRRPPAHSQAERRRFRPMTSAATAFRDKIEERQ
jgi:hypothetical protein